MTTTPANLPVPAAPRIRPGDRIGIGISPRVEMDTYNPLRPTVYIERVMGDTPRRDLQEMQAILAEVLLPRALMLEIKQKRHYQEVWDEHGADDVEGFIRALQREADHGQPRGTGTAPSAVPGSTPPAKST
jgi:hypothetical protein